jgi:hypothetical protein
MGWNGFPLDANPEMDMDLASLGNSFLVGKKCWTIETQSNKLGSKKILLQ